MTFSSGTTYGISFLAAGSQPGMAAAAEAVAANFRNDRLDSPSDISFPRSVVADKTFLRGAALGMAIHAETHVDLVHRHDPVHGFDRSVAFLALHTSPDMGFVNEAHKIRQRVNAIPADFERRLLFIRPRPRYRLNSAEQRAAVTTDAALDRGHARVGRSPRILMAVLAGNLVDSSVYPVAERNRLHDVGPCGPWALRDPDHVQADHEQEHGDRD